MVCHFCHRKFDVDQCAAPSPRLGFDCRLERIYASRTALCLQPGTLSLFSSRRRGAVCFWHRRTSTRSYCLLGHLLSRRLNGLPRRLHMVPLGRGLADDKTDGKAPTHAVLGQIEFA